MIHQGLPVPRTYVLPFSVHEHFRLDGAGCLEQIQQVLQHHLKPECAYAVRSSASLEDAHQHSFAGQFNTYLNIKRIENIRQVIEKLLDSDISSMVLAYSNKLGKGSGDHRLAVIIQEMVQPVVSGVAFSKNPLTGLDEIIVEAIQGSGEQLLQEGRTPDRWVKKWGKWISLPEKSEIDGKLIDVVSEQTIRIAKKYGRPVDLEWVYDGQNLYWVQLRPITGLDKINIYSNRISKEMFPGMIRPLIWSVNTRLVNSAWIKIFTELIGPNDLKPEDLARSFAYRAYFNMGTVGRILTLLGLPKESLELMLGIEGGGEQRPRFRPSGRTFLLLPRMAWFLLKKNRLLGRTLFEIQHIRSEYSRLLSTPARDRTLSELMEDIDRLYSINLKTAEYNIVTPLALGISSMLLRRQLTRAGVNFAQFNLADGIPEMKDYDPKFHLRRLAEQFNAFEPALRHRISVSSYQEFCSIPGIAAFQAGVAGFLASFGHLSESGNDFSAVPWRETPDLVLNMIQSEANRFANAPSNDAELLTKRQTGRETVEKEAKVTWKSLNLKPWQRFFLRPGYQRARRHLMYREAVSSTYTYGYGLFRIYFLELGERLLQHRIIHQAEDIFFLEWDEIRQLVKLLEMSRNEDTLSRYLQLIADRKSELERSRDLVLPEVIYGEELPPVLDATEIKQVLKGVPSSSGYYRGPVRVIRSIAEFAKLVDGDVLVIPYSDVSWTPLFARAGAVIAESGGLLSHSSIVAREYNLPCVVSVPNACQLQDDQIVTVDGYKGEIYLVSQP
jgi:pyruvate,water dikinase